MLTPDRVSTFPPIEKKDTECMMMPPETIIKELWQCVNISTPKP